MDRNLIGRAGVAAIFGATVLAASLGTASASDEAEAPSEARTATVHVGDEFVTSGEIPTLTRSTAAEYWTPERLANAPGLELGADGTFERADSGDVTAIPFSSNTVDNPAVWPNRVHGKIFGTFAGQGNYSCSGSMVSSNSESLVVTAGHCVFSESPKTFASNLIFIPGYSTGSAPYFFWPVTNYITPKQWAKGGKFDYDFAMMRVARGAASLQSVIGSRGIAFDAPKRQRLTAFGYPGRGPSPDYDGNHLIRCNSGYSPDRGNHGGPTSIGMHCDMQQGASGGGIVARGALVGNVSHGHLTPAGGNKPGELYGPAYGRVAKTMYKAKVFGWPSIGPISCNGQVADIVGTTRKDKIKGTGKGEVIASLGSRDVIKAGGGRDVICAGDGSDRVSSGNGRDYVNGGTGKDRCGKGRDNRLNCE